MRKIRAIDYVLSFTAACVLLLLVARPIANHVSQKSWIRYAAQNRHDGQIGISVLSDELFVMFWAWVGFFLLFIAARWIYATRFQRKAPHGERAGRFGLVLTLLLFMPFLQAQTSPDEQQIRAARQSSNEAIRHHDLKTFASSLDDDFVMIRGSGVFVPTRQAYIDTFAADFATPNSVAYERTPDKIEISAAAPLAAEQGHWLGTRPDGTRSYGGTYLAMWRKTPSGWKLRSELFVVLNCYDGPACAQYRKP